MSAVLPLFPDLLEQADPFGRANDHVHRGHGVWCLGPSLGGNPNRRVEDCSELRMLVVIYDDERHTFQRDRTGELWTVELRHYFNRWTTTNRGQREMRQTVRFHERSFVTREEAIALAERLLAIFQRLARRPEDESNETAEEIEETTA